MRVRSLDIIRPLPILISDQVLSSIINGSNSVVSMINGRGADGPRNETVSRLWGLTRTTPGSIAASAMLVIYILTLYFWVPHSHSSRLGGRFPKTISYKEKACLQESTGISNMKAISNTLSKVCDSAKLALSTSFEFGTKPFSPTPPIVLVGKACA